MAISRTPVEKSEVLAIVNLLGQRPRNPLSPAQVMLNWLRHRAVVSLQGYLCWGVAFIEEEQEVRRGGENLSPGGWPTARRNPVLWQGHC